MTTEDKKSKIPLKVCLVIIGLTIAGCAGLVREVFRTADELALRSNGLEITGVVQNLDTKYSRRGGTTYYVEYQFMTGNNQPVRASDRVTQEYWENLSVGTNLPVIYNPTDISNNRVNLPDEEPLMSNLANFGCYSVALLTGMLIFAGTLVGKKE